MKLPKYIVCIKFPISDMKRALYYSFFKILIFISGKANGGFAYFVFLLCDLCMLFWFLSNGVEAFLEYAS